MVLPGGAEVPGAVSGLIAVELSAARQPSEEAEPGVEATIGLTGKHRIPALDGATVNVRFTQRVRKHVLSVPLTALIAIGGERFAVYATKPRSESGSSSPPASPPTATSRSRARGCARA